MPIPKSTPVTAWEFTRDEFYAATRFTELNLMLFQNLKADAVENKSTLKINFDESPSLELANVRYMQREAELNGMIQAYDRLVELFASTNLETPNV